MSSSWGGQACRWGCMMRSAAGRQVNTVSLSLPQAVATAVETATASAYAEALVKIQSCSVSGGRRLLARAAF